MVINQKELYDKAREYYGMENQINVCIEEMSELTKELCKLRRGRSNFEEIAEELADVEIMTEQLKQFFKLDEAVKTFKDRKLARLLMRIMKDDI